MERGSFGREQVADPPMLAAVRAGRFVNALDVGCGEGRFCRMMQADGIATVGIDPTPALIAHARRLDPHGDYRLGRAEALDFADTSFDLVVSYLTLIDIEDYSGAIGEMARVLRPGGTLLIANLNGFITAASETGWRPGLRPSTSPRMVRYLEEHAAWAEWRGIRVRNWHRPHSAYMSRLLQAGLVLTSFEEPAPVGGETDRIASYRDAPFFHVMTWRKP